MDLKFKAIFGYIVSWWASWDLFRPCLKEKGKAGKFQNIEEKPPGTCLFRWCVSPVTPTPTPTSFLLFVFVSALLHSHPVVQAGFMATLLP